MNALNQRILVGSRVRFVDGTVGVVTSGFGLSPRTRGTAIGVTLDDGGGMRQEGYDVVEIVSLPMEEATL